MPLPEGGALLYEGTRVGDVSPVAPGARVQTLDILRGVALFGVLLSNLNHYDPLPEATQLDRALFWVQANLVQNRFYSLLGLLFGVGFAIQLGRAEAAGRDVRRVFYRRMLVLLLFGVLHGVFIWSGDILTRFAIVGLLLPFYRRLSSRGLLWAAALTFFVGSYLVLLILGAINPTRPQPPPDPAVIYATGTWLQILPVRATEYFTSVRWDIIGFGGRCVPFLTLFVLGLWAERSGLISHLGERLGWVRRAFWVALVVVVLGVIAAINFDSWWPQPASMWPVWDLPHVLGAYYFVARRIPDALITWGTALVYATGLTLLAYRPWWSRMFRPVAAVGRMSLTTYLAQSAISTLLFYGYGLGWYGKVSYTGMMGLTLVIFAVQMAFSAWWFRRYRFGPAEWVWRSLSYGRRQPLRTTT